MTTKLFIPKSCKKYNRLFPLDRMKLLWWWERDLDFPRSPFVFSGDKKDIQSYLRNLTKSEI